MSLTISALSGGASVATFSTKYLLPEYSRFTTKRSKLRRGFYIYLVHPVLQAEVKRNVSGPYEHPFVLILC
jgi:hypothetical protein